MRWGRRKKCCDVGCCDVVVLIRRVFRCARSWDNYSIGTLEHKGWFEGCERIVYKERLFGVGGFPFLLSLLVLLYSNQKYESGKNILTLVFVFVPRYALRAQCCNIQITRAQPRPLQQCLWPSTGQWGGLLDFLPKIESSYRAAGSDRGKHLMWWDCHKALEGRAGSSGRNGYKMVPKGILM